MPWASGPSNPTQGRTVGASNAVHAEEGWARLSEE